MRAFLAGFLTILALTSCTGSPDAPTPDKKANPAPTDRVSTPEQSPGPAAPVSLSCGGVEQALVVGTRQKITGEVFGRPLLVPPPRDHNNKILWRASQRGPGDLVISASLNGSDLRVQRLVEGGPGPSIINMPEAGCWTFSLKWPGHHDVVAVRYGHRAAA